MAVTSVAVRARRAITGQSAAELLAELRTREYPEPARGAAGDAGAV